MPTEAVFRVVFACVCCVFIFVLEIWNNLVTEIVTFYTGIGDDAPVVTGIGLGWDKICPRVALYCRWLSNEKSNYRTVRFNKQEIKTAAGRIESILVIYMFNELLDYNGSQML